MLSFVEARQTILDNVTHLGVEQVSILKSLGRVAGADVLAPRNLPSFDNSSMDGFAVRMEDRDHFASLRVSGYIPAGEFTTASVTPGTAIRIMTGAPIPQDCDAIVPFEDAEEFANTINIRIEVVAGQYIRRAGEDIRMGDIALAAGSPIRVPEISLLASLGRTSVAVYRKPRVAILATGDELVEPGQPISPGRLYNSNSVALAAAVLEAGGSPLILGIATDTRESLREKLCDGLQADVLITVAGVSVGDRDMVREILRELNVRQVFWKIDMKPGKATAFGMKDATPVFSLPGNPVSAMVTFEELVRPALLRIMGYKRVIKPGLKAILQHSHHKPAGKTQLLRVRLEARDGTLLAWSAGNQDTRFLKTLLQADALAVLPSERVSFSEGEEIAVHLLSNRAGILESFPANASTTGTPKCLSVIENSSEPCIP
jgi:molybdopterin molybdotransferase